MSIQPAVEDMAPVPIEADPAPDPVAGDPALDPTMPDMVENVPESPSPGPEMVELPIPPRTRIPHGDKKASFTDRVQFATDAELEDRVRIAAIMTALEVSSQKRPDESDDDRIRSNQRRALAREVLADPNVFAKRLQWVLSCTQAGSTISSKCSDHEILMCTAAVWDALAGA